LNNQRLLSVYRLWAPVYDIVFGCLSARPRHRTIELLTLQPGERLLIPGVGTGLDLPYIPACISVVAADLSPAMLTRAKIKGGHHGTGLLLMNGQQLACPNETFDAVLLNLILSVVPDGATAFGEAWRMLKPGGRIVLFDKFLPEGASLTPGRQRLGQVIRALGTDPNRRLSEVIGDRPGMTIDLDEASLLGGQYRIVRLWKA
jgi:phosphatidylethanolamine/phosphatidyl-N-methylethanolamine N-methyltransferase